VTRRPILHYLEWLKALLHYDRIVFAEVVLRVKDENAAGLLQHRLDRIDPSLEFSVFLFKMKQAVVQIAETEIIGAIPFHFGINRFDLFRYGIVKRFL
jgi:hypothetical protein